MTRSRATLATLLVGATLFFPAPSSADEADIDQQIEALLGDPQIFRSTIADIQQRVADEDSIAVSAFISYPITVSIDGKRKTLRQAEDLEEYYGDIFTPDIVEVIVNQDYGNLFVNGDGVMFGSGEVWMSAICLDDGCNEIEAKIITIQAAE